MNELAHYMKAFQSLHVNKTHGLKAPHKAVLLLAVIDQVEEGGISSPHVVLTDALVECFNTIWSRYVGSSTYFKPGICQPFFHMQHETFWRLVEREEAEDRACGMAAESRLFGGSTGERKMLPRSGYSINSMRSAFAYAEMDEALFLLLRNADARAMLRVLLINTYLTNQPTRTMPNIAKLLAMLPLLTLAA